jgi:predicted phage terminase large subunit-like protein
MARLTPAAFAMYASQDRWELARHHALLNRKLVDVAAGRCPRLIVEMPPQHGKSQMVSQYGTAWALGTFPDKRIILSSYEAGFAAYWGRKSRDLLEEHGPRVFGVKVSQKSSAADHWEIEGHQGMMNTAGVGGPITGKSADLLIVDDPIKNPEEAHSQVIREKIWEWFDNVAMTRLQPGAAVIVIMCMTGDTPVLMADGTERDLRDIKIGDSVATYENEKLTTSRVLNHLSQGKDKIIKMTMASGKSVRANERHPFLANDHGELKWIPLKDLTTEHTIATVRGNGASGRARPASLRDATSRSAPGDTAPLTTIRRCGPTDTDPHPATPGPAETSGSNNAMAYPPPTTTPCSPSRMGNVLSASNRRATTCERIGVASSASTMTTRLERSEDCCAMTATSPWDTQRPKSSLFPLQNISDFTLEQIAKIEPDGIEEVFDVQIARTENFIANGIVSHNTRWHKDDLAGRLERKGGWEVIKLPAIALSGDPLGRAPGEGLWTEHFGEGYYEQVRTDSSPYKWASLYQQDPTEEGGNIIKSDWLQWFKHEQHPVMDLIIQSWDTAFKEGTQNDYSVCGTWGATGNGYYLLDLWRGRVSFPDLERRAVELYNRWHPEAVLVEDKASGQSLLQTLQRDTLIPLLAISVERDKVSRLNAVSPLFESKRVHVPDNAPWTSEYVSELCSFPNAPNDDQVDMTSQALAYLRQRGTQSNSVPLEQASVRSRVPSLRSGSWR